MKTSLLKRAAAEAIGTFFIVLAGCGALALESRFPGTIAPGAVPVIFGLVVAALIYAVGHICGAHFNPAVTLGFAVGKHFPPREVPYYWAAQFLGALAAVGLLRLVLPEGSNFGGTVAHVPALAALAWEVVLTFGLMFVILAVATDTRAVGTMAGAAIGAMVTVGAFVGGPISGGSLNPARSLAPAVFEGHFDHGAIYFAGPALGAVLAALVYGWLRAGSEGDTP